MGATAREYDVGAATLDEFELVFNNPGKPLPRQPLCIVLGIAKGTTSPNQGRQCVVIIKPVGRRDMYERIGVGFLPGKCISPPTGYVEIC